MADLRRDYVQTLFERMDELEMFQLEDQFKKLEAEGRAALEASGIADRPDRFRARRRHALRRSGTRGGGAHARQGR